MNNTTPDAATQQIARAFDPARLIQARRLSKMTKNELHQRVGVSAAAIGQYERGEVRPRADTILHLARALNVPTGYFAYGRPRVQIEISQASFRRLRATSVLQQQQAVTYAEHVWELSSLLEEEVEFPNLDLPEWAIGDDALPGGSIDPAWAARSLREYWKLGDRPIRFLVAELEQRGILVVFFSMREEGDDQKRHIDAFSTSVTPRPMIVLTPDKADDVMRHRFSAAYELGHLVLHRPDQARDAHMEREADAFAAEFLTPREVMAEELPKRFNLARLQEIGLKWGVSVKSLIFRSRELDLISEATAGRGYVTLATLSRDEVIRAEPVARYPGEKPDLLRNAIVLLATVNVSVADLAKSLQWPSSLVRRIAGIEEDRPRLSLVRAADDSEM